MQNQLETLRLEASDDTITSDQRSWKRVEGLCNFIENQRDSLKTLQIWVPLVLEENIINHIGKAISNLYNLKDLYLSINSSYIIQHEFFLDYFEETLQEEIPTRDQKSLKISNTWNPSLAKYIKRLENLEKFKLSFDLRQKSPNEETQWLIDIMRVLSSLERLRSIEIGTKSWEQFIPEEQRMIAAVVEMRNVKEFEFRFEDPADELDSHFETLIETIEEVNKRQSMRCDLMF